MAARAAAIFGIVVLLPAALWFRLCAPPSRNHELVHVTIAPGLSLRGIGDVLERHHAIRSGLAFAIFARLNEGEQKPRSGRHTLYRDMSLKQVLVALRAADSLDAGVSVTIPEGFTLAQIAAKLRDKGIVDEPDFLAAARVDNPDSTSGLDYVLPHDSLEGYLYPDTYRFKSRTNAATVVRSMLMNFGVRFARPYRLEITNQESNGRKLTLGQIVTLASLIEREAKVPRDRARISGVITNRLKRKMRLEVDATVLYALGHHKQRVLYRDLKVDSAYNTYLHAGLPPGPIANPGLDSLLAALHPEQNRYLYYVARQNGTHIFSTTLAEHEAAKRAVRRERMARSSGSEAVPGGN